MQGGKGLEDLLRKGENDHLPVLQPFENFMAARRNLRGPYGDRFFGDGAGRNKIGKGKKGGRWIRVEFHPSCGILGIIRRRVDRKS